MTAGPSETSRSRSHSRLLDTEDPANRRVVDLFARRDERGQPLDEPAYYPPLERLTTHPDILDRVWKKLGSEIPPGCARFVHGVGCLVQDHSGIVLAFGWGTAYALRLPPPELAEALLAGASAAMRWSGGAVTDLSEQLGPDWVWGKFAGREPAWVAAAYRAFTGL